MARAYSVKAASRRAVKKLERMQETLNAIGSEFEDVDQSPMNAADEIHIQIGRMIITMQEMEHKEA